VSAQGGFGGRILILYFSGAGATKKVAELIHARLSLTCAADIFPIESGGFDISDYDALAVGTPVYHAAPPRLLTRYIEGIRPPAKATPALIFNTKGLCALNTNRILAGQLRGKNIITIADASYRSPASDGALLAPGVKRFFEFERGLSRKVAEDCAAFVGLLEAGGWRGYIPRFCFGGVVNAPNKLAGRLIRLRIHLHRERCAKCGLCVANCPSGALGRDSSGWPVPAKSKCANCYRCIHKCPGLALSLSRRRPPARVLRY